jgi:hypothetical protein
VGALRPCCVKPWAFPPGKQTLLICDVAVGIPWRLPEGAQVYGEWDKEAAGTLRQRLTQWAISHTGCELCSPQGWLRVATGGRAEAAERVDKDQVLSFSFRVCSVYSARMTSYCISSCLISTPYLSQDVCSYISMNFSAIQFLIYSG